MLFYMNNSNFFIFSWGYFIMSTQHFNNTTKQNTIVTTGWQVSALRLVQFLSHTDSPSLGPFGPSCPQARNTQVTSCLTPLGCADRPVQSLWSHWSHLFQNKLGGTILITLFGNKDWRKKEYITTYTLWIPFKEVLF